MSELIVMFPTTNLFQYAECIHHATDGCNRPYCHFRHSKKKSVNGDDYTDREIPDTVQPSTSTTSSSTKETAVVKLSHLPINYIPQQPSSLRQYRSEISRPSSKVLEYIPRPIVKITERKDVGNIATYIPTSTEALRKRQLLENNVEQNQLKIEEIKKTIRNNIVLNKEIDCAKNVEIDNINNENQNSKNKIKEIEANSSDQQISVSSPTDNLAQKDEKSEKIHTKTDSSKMSKKHSSRSSQSQKEKSRSNSNSRSTKRSSHSSKKDHKSSKSDKKTHRSSDDKKRSGSGSKSSSKSSKIINGKHKDSLSADTSISDDLKNLSVSSSVITVEESEPEEDDDEKILKECYEMFQAYSEPVDLQSTQQAEKLNNQNDEMPQTNLKRRIAHNTNDTSSQSQIAPVKKFKNNLQETLYMRAISACVDSDNDEDTAHKETVMKTVGKNEKRIANTNKNKILPSLLLPDGSRLPYFVRDEGLKTIAFECMSLYDDYDEACERAKNEEKNVYEKCLTVKVYRNSIRLTILKIRKEIAAKSERNGTDDKCAMNENKNIINVTSTSIILKSFKLNVLEFYDFLLQLIPSKEILFENNYPRPVNGKNGRAIIKKLAINCNDRISLVRKCDRCSKTYKVNVRGFPERKEECIYHPQRRIMKKGEVIFSCCSGDSSMSGCSTAALHVSTGFDPFEVNNFVHTLKPEKGSYTHGIYALDCEMCYTTRALELTRITVVDASLKVVFDRLVKPENPIIDYNTKFSGITADTLRNVTDKLSTIQAALLTMFNQETILIGHSLESDLKSLHIFHDKIVDTSLIFPHAGGGTKKRALRTLAAEFLKKIIQNETTGHSSDEDAITCMELMLQKFLDKV